MKIYLFNKLYMIITQTALPLGSNVKNDSHLLIKNIIKNEEGFIVTVKESTAFQKINKWWGWPNPEERELFTVLLIPDGDYIDLYLENKNTLIDTFVFVNRETVIQINNLKRGLPVDLTQVVWPRRADGSMDYPPPITVADTTFANNTQEEPVDNISDDENINQINSNLNSTETNSMPLWLWIVIAGGAVASGVMFIMKQKK